jgi:hypothetical protein
MHKILTSALALLVLTNCNSPSGGQFSKFIGDPPKNIYIDDHKIAKAIKLNVSMPHGDNNSESCRFAGKIILPDNLTYSSYMQKVMRESLYLSDRLAADTDKLAKNVTIVLTKVGFQSYSGQWAIEGKVFINDRKIMSITATENFQTNMNSDAACLAAVNSFDEACKNFILQALYHPQVIANINKQ